MVALAAWGPERRGPHGERVGPDGKQLRACGAVRVSSKGQTQGHSPQTQREGILRAAREYGYLIDVADIFEDAKRGHILKRAGYQAIIRGIEDGKYSACFVFMFDRLGRAGVERVARAFDWDKRGVLLISVTEGIDQPGVLRYVRIGMAEEESRRIALRVVPNRLKGAEMGRHQGRTPYGYVRVYPETVGQRKVAGLLVPNPKTAPIVQELYQRYASGVWSSRTLADDLNSRGVPPPKPTDEHGQPRRWTTGSVHAILTNETYAASPSDPEHGTLVYGTHKVGFYLTTPGLHVGVGLHVPLIDRDLFAQVQQRLASARFRAVTPGPRQHRPVWLAGVLHCAECGGRMIPSLRRSASDRGDEHGKLWCSDRYHGRTSCRGRSYRLDLAEQGVLDQLRRLQDAPWDVGKERHLAGSDGAVAAQIQQHLDEARATLARANRRFLIEIKEPTQEDRDAFELVRCEMGARIRELETQLATMKHDAQAVPRLRRLHQQLTQTEIGPLLDRLLAAGDLVGLRDLVAALMTSATLAERVPAFRSTWLRFDVVWSEDVRSLLAAGLLRLAPEPTCPQPPPPARRVRKVAVAEGKRRDVGAALHEERSS